MHVAAIHFDFAALIQPLAPILTLALAALAAHWIKRPSDLQRAQLLATLAQDMAVWAVKTYPGKGWTDYVRIVSDALAQVAGVPTTDQRALERASMSALQALGVKQP